jgi:rare lipoprotein A
MTWKGIKLTGAALLAVGVGLHGCSAARATTNPAGSSGALETVQGTASYYADALAGNPTASGVPYDPSSLIAAHRTYPFGTLLRVRNLSNGYVVEVRVVDRGPFVQGRVLDLSRAAAERLDFIREGLARVQIEVLEWGA